MNSVTQVASRLEELVSQLESLPNVTALLSCDPAVLEKPRIILGGVHYALAEGYYQDNPLEAQQTCLFLETYCQSSQRLLSALEDDLLDGALEA